MLLKEKPISSSEILTVLAVPIAVLAAACAIADFFMGASSIALWCILGLLIFIVVSLFCD